MATPALTTLARRGMLAVALGLLALLFIKALAEAPHHFDSWWYHLPWAARLAGLVSAKSYAFEPVAAMRFEGFTLLPEFLQGWFWRLSGRVEAANLVNLVSLLAFLVFLRRFFQVPLGLAVPALLAVPLIQSHAASTYVDLIANLGMAACVMAIYTLHVRPEPARPGQITALAIGAFVAAHGKMQLLPLVALALPFAAWPLYPWLKRQLQRRQGGARKALMLAAVALVLAAIYYVPLKNLVVLGNPVYPVRVTLPGLVLNGPEAPPKELGGGELDNAGHLTKWFYSVTELGMGPVLNVKRWSLDSAAPENSPLAIQGGLFGAYVGFHVLLFLWLVRRLDGRERVAAITLAGVSTLTAALMPASHLLRYYMFWFIVLISLNLHFISRSRQEWPGLALGAVCLGFFLVVVDASDQNFMHPRFQSMQELLDERVDPRILAQLRESNTACLALDHADQPFLYASLWHPGTDFRITAGPFFPDAPGELEQVCAGLKIIRSGAAAPLP